jgi:hypothetical protein
VKSRIFTRSISQSVWHGREPGVAVWLDRITQRLTSRVGHRSISQSAWPGRQPLVADAVAGPHLARRVGGILRAKPLDLTPRVAHRYCAGNPSSLTLWLDRISLGVSVVFCVGHRFVSHRVWRTAFVQATPRR